MMGHSHPAVIPGSWEVEIGRATLGKNMRTYLTKKRRRKRWREEGTKENKTSMVGWPSPVSNQ
jgi:hypothetical protein